MNITSKSMTRKPTHAEIAHLLTTLLPPRVNDVPLLYHFPQNASYHFQTAQADQVVLSVTPTGRFYNSVGEDPDKAPRTPPQRPQARRDIQEERPLNNKEEGRIPNTVAFLHRPFELDTSRVRADLMVLASHTSFDENLTVGWNPALAEKLGVDISSGNYLCIQGHKGDPDRKIVLVASVSLLLGPLLQAIETEFGSIDHAQEGLSEEIHVLATMNAFSADEVERVLDEAENQHWVPDAVSAGRHVLYLTGQPRKSGLQAAKERGMTVVCVGHRVAEQWGITYLAAKLREAFPAIHVREIYEDELPMHYTATPESRPIYTSRNPESVDGETTPSE
ncbi:hypothetical protein M011DRAFT_467686 [Sporormia fimetaria CBS 119925]|uniref:NGG1p interacting factor 3 n=1 Tax=Sporormia fimetaria CBS 119925 TaxID=1340428 RepID=A0A6A6VBW6_9PLEO|nr:hypothetical protein M011DRAFT_467686 [Sporormia fimetaria CBS 119925]